MKKQSILFILLLAGVALLANIFIAGGAPQARGAASTGVYLAGSAPTSDWTVMALSAGNDAMVETDFLASLSGTTANDYAKRILAITSLGEDPRSFGNENYIYKLQQLSVNGQLGDASLLSDDLFGVLALRSAGVSSSHALVTQEKAYIESQQLSDGSWDFAANSTSGSIDFAALGIMALLSAGASPSDSVIIAATDYIFDAQNDDGGFPITPGDDSNAESTAWALSALYALGEDPNFWVPVDQSPADYLAGLLTDEGYYLFNASASAADLRTPVTTAYAHIAASGSYFPVASIALPPSADIRVEGINNSICDSVARGSDALALVKSASSACDYTYVIETYEWGPYLTTINQDVAAGLIGWNFIVNHESLQIGANQFSVSEDDALLLYYGNWDDQELRITHADTVLSLNAQSAAIVEKYVNGAWEPASGATVYRGNDEFTADTNGAVALTWNAAGVYPLYAGGDGYIRSNRVMVAVGDGVSQQSVPLSVTIQNGGSSGQQDQQTPAVSFGVTGDLNFGSLTPGSSSTKSVTINNTGSSSITTTATVSGSEVFTNNLQLDSTAPASWSKIVGVSATAPVAVTLSIPGSYTQTGSVSGSLIFWANVAQ